MAKNGDTQFWKEKFHAAIGKAQHALMMGAVFSFWGGPGRGTFFPPGSQSVPDMFPSSSQSVPKCIPQHVPNSTWVCLKSNSHVYKPKRSNVREHICFYFVTGVQRGAPIGECSMVQKNCWRANGNGSFPKKNQKNKKTKKSYERTHDLINMNHTTIRQLIWITLCPPQVLLLNKVPKISFILGHTSICPVFSLLFQFLLWWSMGQSLLLRMSPNLRLVPSGVVTL